MSSTFFFGNFQKSVSLTDISDPREIDHGRPVRAVQGVVEVVRPAVHGPAQVPAVCVDVAEGDHAREGVAGVHDDGFAQLHRSWGQGKLEAEDRLRWGLNENKIK